MLRYVIRRLLLIIPTMFFVALITFTLAHAAPGSPFDKNANRTLPQETIDRLNRYYGIDQPIPIQFVDYLGNLIRGDLVQWGAIAAAVLIPSIPLALLYNTFLNRFIAGFTGGAFR